MQINSSSRIRAEDLRISSVERPGWRLVPGLVPEVGARVLCVEGPAEVVRILGRVGDGGRLLELMLPDRPKTPFFASSANVLHRAEHDIG